MSQDAVQAGEPGGQPDPQDDARSKAILRRLEWRYCGAFALTLCLLVTCWLFEDLRFLTRAKDTVVIYTAGRQVVLAQRLMYLAHLGDAMTAKSMEEQRRILVNFDQNQANLFELAALEPRIQAIYVGTPQDAGLNDAAVAFSLAGRKAIAEPQDPAALAALRAAGEGKFLFELDNAASAFATASTANLANSRWWGDVSLVAAIATLLAELCLVFLPGHKAMKGMIRALKNDYYQQRCNYDQQVRMTDELRQGQTLLRRKSVQLEKSLAESEALRQEQLAFTYAMSHDLKSPSNTIAMVFSELEEIGLQPLGNDAQDLVNIAKHAISRMGVLIDDVLTFGNIANTASESEWVSLPAMIEEIRADLTADLTAARARIDTRDLGLVWAQPLQMRSLLQNLISNAIKFRTPERSPVVQVSMEIAPGVARLHVSDNGISIPCEDRLKVLQLFKRLHNNKSYSGSGIGLALCDRIARNHDGALWFEDHDGPGITVVASIGRQGSDLDHGNPTHQADQAA